MNSNPTFIPILRETLTKTVAKLPAALRPQIDAPLLAAGAEEPTWNPHRIKEIYHYRAVLMPAKRPFRPKGFWNAKYCMYEIAVGYFRGRAGIQVQMLCASNRKCCGKLAYARPLGDIYRVAAARNPKLDVEGVETEGYLSLIRVLTGFDTEQASTDMAWIIAETFPRIIALPDAPKNS